MTDSKKSSNSIKKIGPKSVIYHMHQTSLHVLVVYAHCINKKAVRVNGSSLLFTIATYIAPFCYLLHCVKMLKFIYCANVIFNSKNTCKLSKNIEKNSKILQINLANFLQCISNRIVMFPFDK